MYSRINTVFVELIEQCDKKVDYYFGTRLDNKACAVYDVVKVLSRYEYEELEKRVFKEMLSRSI